MEMPKPTAAHRKLEALEGEWEGEESLFPSPLSPEGGTATGRFSFRIGLDGLFLLSDYEQRRSAGIAFRGHGVYGWDSARERYTMYWFDSSGINPTGPVLGTWQGDTLAFQTESPIGHHRYVYDVSGGDSFRFRLDGSRDGQSWTTFMEGEYRRGG